MSERVKFYLDEHVHPAVANGLRLRGIDALTTHEADMLGATDGEHLSLALRENRAIFTQDDDFLRLSADGAGHAGIVYVRQITSVGYIVQGLTLIYQVLSPDDMKNRIEFL